MRKGDPRSPQIYTGRRRIGNTDSSKLVRHAGWKFRLLVITADYNVNGDCRSETSIHLDGHCRRACDYVFPSPGAEFGGDGNFFSRAKISERRFFRKNVPFSRPKIQHQ